MSFWNTKEGKILSHGIHDHTGFLSVQRHFLESMQKYQKENKPLDNKFWLYLEAALNERKKAMEAMDYIYVKFKEEYEKELKE